MAARQYYAKVPVLNGFENDYYWSALDAKTLTAAQFLASKNGVIVEIGIRQPAGMQVISVKNKEGKWVLVYENEDRKTA